MEKIPIVQLLNFIPLSYYKVYISHSIIANTLVILVTLDSDVTRAPAINSRVLPLAVAGWTLCSVNTHVGTRETYLTTSTPGAVTVSVQIYALTVPVDCRLLVHLSSGLIVAKIP